MIILSLSSVVRQWLIVVAANLSGLGAGVCLGWPSPVLIKLEDRNSTVLVRPYTDDEATWLASISQLFCVIFLLIGSPVVDRIGRKYSFAVVYVPKLVACLMFLFATQVWELMLARVFEGISLAFYYVVLATYTAEIADKNIRGALGTVIQTFRSSGLMLILAVAPFLNYTGLHLFYLGLTVASALPAIFLPETPYFLYSKGKTEESERVLNSLRTTKQEVHDELQMFENNKNKEKLDIRQLLKNRLFLKAIGICLFLSAIGPCTGFTFVVFYLQNVMVAAETNINPEMASLVVGVMQLLACFPPIFMADRFGRKPLLIVNMLLVTLGTIGLGTFFWCKEVGYELNAFLNVLPTLSASLITLAVSGYLSTLFILAPELFLGEQRALGVSVTSFALSLGIFAVAKSYSALVTSLGFAGSFFMFSGVSVIIMLFVMFCVPETKGKMFDEIQEDLGGKVVMKVDES